ncbi:MAG TPA: patatin-like phospholipase family protein [Streptosporangiaceae bacterium]
MTTRALVLGGGGITGAAWEVGVIAGLAGEGIDLAGADLIVGTSAGAVVGTGLAAGTDPAKLYEVQLAPPVGELEQRLGFWLTMRWAWIMLTSRDAIRVRRRLGRVALTSRTITLAARRKVIESRFDNYDWPRSPLKITTVDARTGERIVFDAAGEASLIDAITASTATPGVQPPVQIGTRQLTDGGLASSANADVAAGFDRVVIIAPGARGTKAIPSPDRQAAGLSAAGASVVVITPDRASGRARGRDVLDLSRRTAAAQAGRAQAAADADRVRAVWAIG